MDWPLAGGRPGRDIMDLHLAPPLVEKIIIRYEAGSPDPPLVAGGRVFMYEPRKWRARDEVTQEILWQREAANSADATFPQFVWKGKVAVWDWASPDLLLLDATTGAEEGRLSITSGWALNVGDTLVSWHGGFVHAVDLPSGRLLWRSVTDPRKDPFTNEPCASQEAVFFGLRSGTVFARGLRDGREMWSLRVPDGPKTAMIRKYGGRTGEPSTICLHKESASLIFQAGGCGVFGVSAHTGEIVWRYDDNGSSVLYGDRLHFLEGDGEYAVLDPATGRVLFRTNLKRTIPGKIASTRVMRNVLAFGLRLVSETHAWVAAGEYLLAFDKNTGEYAWHYLTKGAGYFFASANGRLYYGDSVAQLHWLEEENPTDPVLKAQRAAAPGGKRKPARRRVERPERQREVSLTILDHSHRRPPGAGPESGWDVLHCRCGEAELFIAVSAEDWDMLSGGPGRMWVKAERDREILLEAGIKAFGRRRKSKLPPFTCPDELEVTFLGTAEEPEEEGGGTWTQSKWAGPEEIPEFFVVWSLDQRRGAIREREDLDRNELLDLLGSLPVHPETA